VVTERHDSAAGWAAGDSHLRASDADREQVVNALKAAFVERRLSRSELVRRTGQALESKTYADLVGASVGIPAGRVATAAPRQRGVTVRVRPVNWKVVAWVASAIIVLPGLAVAFFDTYSGSLYVGLLLWVLAAGLSGSPWPPWRGRGRAY
jgi:hypothetical protein